MMLDEQLNSIRTQKDIDETVDHVVYYCETGMWPKANDEKQRHYSRQTEVDDSDKDDSSLDEDSQATRIGIGQRRSRVGRTRNRNWGMPVVQVRSNLVSHCSRCPLRLKQTRQSKYESSKNK